jgi:hypothetical protein
MTIQALVLSGDGVEQRAIVSRDGVERERERERGCARDTAELAATAGGKAVGDANTDKKTIQGCGLLQPRQERRRRREGAEWVTSRLGSLLGSHLHSGGFFLSFPI